MTEAPEGYRKLPVGVSCRCIKLWQGADGTRWCCGARPAEPQPQAARPTEDDGWTWAIVEIFGHRRHAGRMREEERFGAKMLRIDVPTRGDPEKNGWETHWYGGSAIFSLTLTDEDSVMRANKPYEPPARYRLPPPRREEEEDCGIEDDYGPRETKTPADRIREAADRAEARSRERQAAADDGMPF